VYHVLTTIRGGVAGTVILVSLVIFFTGLLPGAFAKLLVRYRPFQRLCDEWMLAFCRAWIRTIELATDHISWQRVVIQENDAPTDRNGRYLLIGNHQTWADIFVLIRVLRGQLPFPRWFIKQQMLWVPIIGFATWALDFPFMKRHSKDEMARNPELRNQDLETTKRACEIYREVPVTVVNYAEGTRFTEAKHAKQESPYRHLLRPKAGGFAFTLNAMGDLLDGALDLTVNYQGVDSPTIWDYVCGRIPEVQVRIRPLEVPSHLRHGDYQNDPDYRARFRAWLEDYWAAKDAELSEMRGEAPSHTTAGARKAS